MKTNFIFRISILWLSLLSTSVLLNAQEIELSDKRKSLGQVVSLIKDGERLLVFRGEGASKAGYFTGMAERHFLEYDMSSLICNTESVVTEKQLKSAKINEQFYQLYKVGKSFFIVYASEVKKNSGHYVVNIIPMDEDFELNLKGVKKVDFKTNSSNDFEFYVVKNEYSDEIAIVLTTSARAGESNKTDDETIVNFYDSNYELQRSVAIEKETKEEMTPIGITKNGVLYYVSTNVSGQKAKNKFQYDYIKRNGFFLGSADIRGTGSTATKEMVANEGQEIVSYEFRMAGDKIHIVTNNYSAQSKKLEESSISYYQYDAVTGNQLQSSKYVLDSKILSRFYKTKDFQKVSKGNNPHGKTQFRLKKMKFDNDGNMIITGYKFRTYVVCDTKRCYTVNEEGPILVMKVSPTGDLIWSNVITRYLGSDANEYFTNYRMFIGKNTNNVYFYFIDNEKNLNVNSIDLLKGVSLKKNIVRVVVLNAKNGKIVLSEVAARSKVVLSTLSMDGLDVEDVTDKAYFYFNGAHADRVGTADLD